MFSKTLDDERDPEVSSDKRFWESSDLFLELYSEFSFLRRIGIPGLIAGNCFRRCGCTFSVSSSGFCNLVLSTSRRTGLATKSSSFKNRIFGIINTLNL